jgi:hypothetical protein
MFKLSFTTNNAAFDQYPATECGRILREIAARVEDEGATKENIYDINGNIIGTFTVTM